jgi:hypothetical protein
MHNTLRALDFSASLHLTIFERPANFEFFAQSANRPPQNGDQMYPTARDNL